MYSMLKIDNLTVKFHEKTIIDQLNLTLDKGRVYALMGPNGSGKSTLTAVLAGNQDYEGSGFVNFLGNNLLSLSPEERAAKGLFIGFQYPIEIPGVSSVNFLKTAINQIRKTNNEPSIETIEFIKLMRRCQEIMSIDKNLLERGLNEGFSGGEKKLNEIFQLLMLNPKLAILDEPDSGVDVDALNQITEGINSFIGTEKTIVIITHYTRILKLVIPDIVHIIKEGKIVLSGDKSLALDVEKHGYSQFK